MSLGKAASAFRKYSRRFCFPRTVPEVSPRSLTTSGEGILHPPCNERGRPRDRVGSTPESSLRFVGRPLAPPSRKQVVCSLWKSDATHEVYETRIGAQA